LRLARHLPRLNQGEESFLFWCRVAKLPEPARNYAEAIPGRNFELDFAWPSIKVGVEIQGGIWRKGGGAHSRPTKIIRDMEKHNLLLDHGWRVWHFLPEHCTRGSAVQHMARVVLLCLAKSDDTDHGRANATAGHGELELGTATGGHDPLVPATTPDAAAAAIRAAGPSAYLAALDSAVDGPGRDLLGDSLPYEVKR
jgi:hypothetical protein